MKLNELYNLKNPTPEQKRLLEHLEKIRQKYPNRSGIATLNARRILYKTPLDSENYNEQAFWQELAEIMKNPLPGKPKLIHTD